MCGRRAKINSTSHIKIQSKEYVQKLCTKRPNKIVCKDQKLDVKSKNVCKKKKNGAGLRQAWKDM